MSRRRSAFLRSEKNTLGLYPLTRDLAPIAPIASWKRSGKGTGFVRRPFFSALLVLLCYKVLNQSMIASEAVS